jgi:two-component system invasion response regulator UvrY
MADNPLEGERMIKVLIADDHAVVREGLKQILSEAPSVTAVVEAQDGQEVLEKVLSNKVDVVLLDITMPGGSGIEILTELKRLRPTLPVLILSVHSEEQYGPRVLRSGASGFVTKESPPEELLAAIRKVVGGGKYVSPKLAEKLASRLNDTSQPVHERLSDREYEVLCKIASGKTVKEIAATLSLSEKTISTYRSRILEKMDLRHNADLIHYAVREELVR